MISLLDFEKVACYDFSNKGVSDTFETECVIPNTETFFYNVTENVFEIKVNDTVTAIYFKTAIENFACCLTCNLILLISAFFFIY